MGLVSATHSNWPKVKECMNQLDGLRKQPGGPLDLLALYLSGVYYQGTGELGAALRILEDPRLAISVDASGRQAPSEVSLLAALNRLWIMQEPSRKNTRKTAELLDQIRQPCQDHPDPDLRTACSLALATVETNPPASMNELKRHIQGGLNGSQLTNNTHCLSIALNIMRARLFENVVGEQAMKSAKAGSTQAKRAGNLLWMSVADGMLAQSYETSGSAAEAQATYAAATRFANDAFTR